MALSRPAPYAHSTCKDEKSALMLQFLAPIWERGFEKARLQGLGPVSLAVLSQVFRFVASYETEKGIGDSLVQFLLLSHLRRHKTGMLRPPSLVNLEFLS